MIKRLSFYLKVLRILFSALLAFTLAVVVLAYKDPKAVESVSFIYAICVLVFLLCLVFFWFQKQDLLVANIENIDDMCDDLKAIRKILESQKQTTSSDEIEEKSKNCTENFVNSKN